MNLVQLLRTRGPSDMPPSEERSSLGDLLEWIQIAGGGGNFLAGLNQTYKPSGDREEIGTDYDTFALQMFSKNPVVFSAVMTRLAVFSQVRFAFRRFESGRPQALFGDRTLRRLERPWAGGTSSDLLGQMLLRSDLAGNAFVWDSGRALHVWRPDWVTIALGSTLHPDDPASAEDVEVVGYYYAPGGQSQNARFYLASEVAHFAPIPDPLASYRGMSWLTPVLREVQADTAATEHKWQFFQNGATPNMVVKFDPSLTVDQAREFKQLMESEHQGVANAYKTLYLGGGADASVVGANFEQIDFKGTQGKGETRIAMASGVPATILGVSEGLAGSSLNAGNYSQAKRLFADVRLQHLWANVCASLETVLPPPDGAELWFDTRSVPFLQDDLKDTAEIQARQAAAIRQLVDGGFDPATVVAAVNSDDMTLLNHTGKLSVQLQEPGTELDDGAERQRSAPAAPPAPPNFNVYMPDQRFDIGAPQVHLQVDGTDVHVPEQRQAQVTVNVDPTPVTIENRVEVDVDPTPVTVANQVDNRIDVQPAPVTVIEADSPSRYQVRRDKDGRISEVVERD